MTLQNSSALIKNISSIESKMNDLNKKWNVPKNILNNDLYVMILLQYLEESTTNSKDIL